MSVAERRMHGLAIVALCSLILATGWLVWLALPGSGTLTAVGTLLLTLPLAAPLPGLLRRHRHTGLWATFLLTPYLALALTEVLANPAARVAAALVMWLILVNLVALVGWLRTSRPRAPRERTAR
jgi:uncharacterized membrane protein